MEGNYLNIYYRNLQKLVTEIFQVKTGLSPELMNNLSDFIEKPYFYEKLRTLDQGRSVQQIMT